MIVTDKPSFDEALSLWSASIKKKGEVLKLNGKSVVEVESARLVEQMIKMFPPRTRDSTSKKIDMDVAVKFQVMGDRQESDKHWGAGGGRAGNKEIRWYAFQSDAIFGAAQDKDLTGADTDSLKDFYYKTKISETGRIILGNRGSQTVYLWRKHIVKKAQLKSLAEQIKKSIGRLKAGWIPAFKELVGRMGSYTPPAWAVLSPNAPQ